MAKYTKYSLWVGVVYGIIDNIDRTRYKKSINSCELDQGQKVMYSMCALGVGKHVVYDILPFVSW